VPRRVAKAQLRTRVSRKLAGSHIRRRFLWAGLWVGKSPQTPKQSTSISQNILLDSFRIADPCFHQGIGVSRVGEASFCICMTRR